MTRRIGWIRIAMALGLVLGAGDAHAQSIFSTRGLGFPVEPQDARSSGLGGVALGFPSGEISWANPAGFINLPAPGLTASYQYDDFAAETSAGEFSGKTARFPMLLVAFPFDRFVAFAGYGSFLDQTWRMENSDTLTIGSEKVPVTDRFSSDGGVVRMRVGAAYELAEGLGVGLGLDAYSGTVERVNGRLFPNESVPICCRGTWSYDGFGLVAGVHWSPTESSGLAASLSYGGSLEATPTDTLGSAAKYDLPLVLRVGASGRISQNTLVALSGSWDGWSALDDGLQSEGGASNTWGAHAGIEWEGITFRDRPLPVRIGARTGSLPFRWQPETGTEWGREQALTGGLGIVLAGGAVRTDLAAEFGDRGGASAGIEESFWRFAFSVRVLGR